MAMTVLELTEILNHTFNPNLAESYDTVGLLVGDCRWPVNKVYLTLEPTLEVIEDAIKNKVDCIVAHHPYGLNAFSKVTNETLLGKKIMDLITHKIALYVAHTNLDRTQGTMNARIAEQLHLSQTTLLLDTHDNQGFGLKGRFDEPITLRTLVNRIKVALKIPFCHVVGDLNQSVETLAICSGSGASFIDLVLEQGIDCYLTGDLKYHDAVYAKEMGLTIIDATHFGTEVMVTEVFKTILAPLPVTCIMDQVSKNPISTQ